jgi:hypothetical protein
VREILTGERLLRRIEWVSGILLTLCALIALLRFSAQAALGVLLGGAIAISSFQVLKWQLRRAFEKPGKLPRKAGLFASSYVRFLATLFLVFMVLYYGWASPVPFLAGLSVVVLSIVLVGGLEFIVMVKKGES